MRLHDGPFDNVRTGRQKVEGRLLDEKRKSIERGNIIRFVRRSNERDFFDAKVIGLNCYESFANMFLDLGPEVFGCDSNYTLDNFVLAYRKYYSAEDEKKYGVVAIKLEVVK